MRSCVLLTIKFIKMDKLQKQALEKHKIIRYKDLFVKVMDTYKTLLEAENEQLRIGAVMPRFSESEIEKMAFEWSSERSIGDAEQDSQCMYDYSQGMRAMQRLLSNEA